MCVIRSEIDICNLAETVQQQNDKWYVRLLRTVTNCIPQNALLPGVPVVLSGDGKSDLSTYGRTVTEDTANTRYLLY
jgi:hypothetical protein